VRDLFQESGQGEEDSSQIVVLVEPLLSDLFDGNWLKPVVWAEDKDNRNNCGVSLGIYNFLRSYAIYDVAAMT
jgi:hypothetical protein